jgi:hypothetical protein
VLAGSSHNIWFNFKRDAHSRDDRLELELQAAGCTIAGERRLPICDTSRCATPFWNCSFQQAGTQTINLILSVVKQPDSYKDSLFTYTHIFEADMGWSASLQPVLTIVIAAISAAAAVLAALNP